MIMKTFKVTYFDKELDVFSVKTYHNVDDQSILIDWVYNYIKVLDLAPVVKMYAGDVCYTPAINDILMTRFNQRLGVVK